MIVFTEKINRCPGKPAARDDRLGEKPVQPARPNRHLFATRRADPEALDGLLAEDVPARFEHVRHVLGELRGIRRRRARPKLAGTGSDSQSQPRQPMQSVGAALMNRTEQAGLHDDAGVGDTDLQ